MKKTATKTASSARRAAPKTADNVKAAPAVKPAAKPAKLSPTGASAALLAKRVDFEAFLGKLAKDRQNIEKHIAASRGRAGQQAPEALEAVGDVAGDAGRACRPDQWAAVDPVLHRRRRRGRYRKQVFALEDLATAR